MNKFLAKLTAVILVGLLFVIGVDCLIGITLGGAIRPLYIVLFFAASVAAGVVGGLVLFGKEGQKTRTAAFVIAVIIILLMYGCYGALNSISKGSDYVTYQTEVTATEHYRYTIFDTVMFTDSRGNTARVKKFDAVAADDFKYEEGKAIRVTEWKGGFGYPVYEIEPAS